MNWQLTTTLRPISAAIARTLGVLAVFAVTTGRSIEALALNLKSRSVIVRPHISLPVCDTCMF